MVLGGHSTQQNRTNQPFPLNFPSPGTEAELEPLRHPSLSVSPRDPLTHSCSPSRPTLTRVAILRSRAIPSALWPVPSLCDHTALGHHTRSPVPALRT